METECSAGFVGTGITFKENKMKLTRKNIGQLFDCRGGDGSWAYQLIDIKGKELLFYSIGGDFWAFKKTYTDWRPFKSQEFYTRDEAWKMARREK